MVSDLLKKLKKGDRVMFPVSELVHPEYNPRSISPDSMKGLKSSIERFGIVQEIVVNKRNGNIIGGNQRVDAAIANGLKEVPIYVEDLPETEEKVLNVTLNNPLIQGEFVGDMLEPMLAEIRDEIGDEVYEDLMLDDIYSGKVDELEEMDFSENIRKKSITLTVSISEYESLKEDLNKLKREYESVQIFL